MFATTCRSCGERLLVFPSQVVSVTNRPDGIEVGYECLCGAPGTHLTGRRRRVEVPAAA